MNVPTSTRRLADFRRDYPENLPEPTVWPALTGKEVSPPKWWKASPNNFAIGVNFRAILMREMELGTTESVMIMEDDVVFLPDFKSRFDAFLESVPDDWDALFLGGDHIGVFLPRQVTPTVLRCRNIWAPHAVILRPSAFQPIIDALGEETPWPCEHRHECRIGELMQLGKLTGYAPLDQMAGQRGGIPSDNASFTREHDEFFPRFDYIDLNGKIQSHGKREEAAE